MATNTRSSSTSKGADKQPSYQYDPWDQDAGNYSSHLNGQDYQGDSGLEQGRDSGKALSQQETATKGLRDAENNALSKNESSFLSNGKHRSLYTGSGKTISPNAGFNAKNLLKGKGALITILLAFVCAGVFLTTSNSLLPAALSTLITSKTQVNYSGYSLRSRYITSYMVKHNSGGAVTTGFTGKMKYTKIPAKLQTRLAAYNIEVEGTGSNTRLSWTHTTSTGGTETISGIDANRFVEMYNNDPKFREAYTNARYGRAATFYDKVADKVYKTLGINRNLQKDYVQTGNAEVDANNYDKTLRPKFDGNGADLETKSTFTRYEEVEVDDGNGGKTTVTEEYPDPVDSSSGGKSSSVSEAEARTSATGMIADIAGRVGKVGSAVCTTLKIGSMIGTAASAMEMYQSINFFMAQMESISKMKAGYGDESAINATLNYLTTSETTDVQDFSPTIFDISKLNFWTGSDGAEHAPEAQAAMTTEKGAPIEASGMQNLLADAPVTSSSGKIDSSTQNYSLERIFKALGGAATFGAGTALTCAGVSLVNSIVSLSVMLSPAGLVSLTGSFLTGIFKSTVAVVAATAFFNFLVPTLANIFYRNVMDTAIGIPGGQFWARGGAAANMDAARRGSATAPSDEKAILAFNHANNEVLAMEAEQDRVRLSPFDTSNPNTFFGSIAYSLLPTLTSSNITGLASFLRSTSSSFASLMGRVSAEGEDSSYITTFGDCPLLDEIGAKGDMYCNAITTTDMDEDLINLDPDDTTYNDVLMNGVSGDANLTCDDEGNCKINKDSNLAKYISYCDNRSSQFGVVDQNILTELGHAPSGILGTAVGIIPGLGEIVSAADAVDQMFGDSIDWANGTKCGNTAKNSKFWNEEGKYYQVYINDQRILDQMGAYEGSTNPVLAYEAEYEAEHPTDDTFIAYLSRISGLTLENTETVLAFVSYYTYINEYDPSVRIAVEDMMFELTGEEVITNITADKVYFEDDDLVDTPLETNAISRQYVIYADVRNRSYTV